MCDGALTTTIHDLSLPHGVDQGFFVGHRVTVEVGAALVVKDYFRRRFALAASGDSGGYKGECDNVMTEEHAE